MPPHHLEDLTSAHVSWDLPVPLVMLKADINPSVMLEAGLKPTFTPMSVSPCKPVPELRLPLLLHEGPVAHVDVYVDDFISLAQGSKELC